MPSETERQRRFMGAELARKRAGEKTETGMSEKQLSEFASKVKSHNWDGPGGAFMPQDVRVNIPHGESPQKTAGKVSQGIHEARLRASHAANVAASRAAAEKEVTYYGGGSMAGESGGGIGPADVYTKEAAKLPVRDAEAMARLQAEEAGGYKKSHNWDGVHGKHTGEAEDMGVFGPNESRVARQNAPFRDLHKSGHDLNHTFKNPAAAVAPDVKAAGTNHSYLHPHSHAGMREAARTAFTKADIIRPMQNMGTGKT